MKKVALFSFLALLGCGTTVVAADGGSGDAAAPIPRGAVMSIVGAGPMASDPECRLMTAPSLSIGNTNSLTIQDGSSWLGGTARITCSMISSANGGFALSARAELAGVPQSSVGTLTVAGTFLPKTGGMSADVSNVTATLTTVNGALKSTSCIGTFDGFDTSGARCNVGMIDANGAITCSQNKTMDAKVGAIWATVFCERATDSSQNPPRTCRTAITFRFENCT